MSQQDLTLAIIAICISALSLIASVLIAMTTLFITGRREHEKWMKEQRISAYNEFLDKVDDAQVAAMRAVQAAEAAGGYFKGTPKDIADAMGRLHSERIRTVCNQRTVTTAEAVERSLSRQVNMLFNYNTSRLPPQEVQREYHERFLVAVKALRQAVRDENGVDATSTPFGERMRGVGKALQGRA